MYFAYVEIRELTENRFFANAMANEYERGLIQSCPTSQGNVFQINSVSEDELQHVTSECVH